MNTPRFAQMATLLTCTALVVLSYPTRGLCGSERAYGKKIVAEYELPPEQIAKFAAFQPSGPVKGESVISSTLLAKTEDWTGPELEGVSSGNPSRKIARSGSRSVW